MITLCQKIARAQATLDHATERIAACHAEIEAQTNARDGARADLDQFQTDLFALVAAPIHTDTPVPGSRYILRQHPNGTRELLDQRAEVVLRYPWSRPASVVARLERALATPMTREQVEQWAMANEINPSTAAGYLPQLVMMRLVVADGLTWRRV